MRKPAMLTLALLIGAFTTVIAQVQFEVPQDLQLRNKDDYAKYEPSVIDAAKWLEQTDLNQQEEKRKQVNQFVFQWVSGSPTVNIDLGESIFKIYGKNEMLLGVYIGSYTRHFLENRSSATKLSAIKAGLLSMVQVYKKGISIKKAKELEKISKLADENQLDTYIALKFAHVNSTR